MFDRIVLPTVQAAARSFPVVAIVGARQVGKTTPARTAFPRFAYRDLEDPRTAPNDAPALQATKRARPPFPIQTQLRQSRGIEANGSRGAVNINGDRLLIRERRFGR